MKNLLTIILIIFSLILTPSEGKEFLYILNDDCINELYTNAENFFKTTSVEVIRDTRGILLSFKLENPIQEFEGMSCKTYSNISHIQEFLAKIKNPAIIEVHTEDFPFSEYRGLRNWEVSTVIANKIETVILKPFGEPNQKRIHSVGYGEFLPANKNTSNNGGNYPNRVDIMILCNISGE